MTLDFYNETVSTWPDSKFCKKIKSLLHLSSKEKVACSLSNVKQPQHVLVHLGLHALSIDLANDQ